MKACVYPGSFDPFTIGHMDIVNRAMKIFDKVTILICRNSSKGERFIPVEKMKECIEYDMQVHFENAGKATVDILPDGLSVLDYMSNHRKELGNCMNIVRGIRDAGDATEEIRLADQYRYFSRDIRFELVPLIARPEYRGLSSSVVREMFKMRQVEPKEWPVPPSVALAIRDSLKK